LPIDRLAVLEEEMAGITSRPFDRVKSYAPIARGFLVRNLPDATVVPYANVARGRVSAKDRLAAFQKSTFLFFPRPEISEEGAVS
jgi:hypothetical protein